MFVEPGSGVDVQADRHRTGCGEATCAALILIVIILLIVFLIVIVTFLLMRLSVLPGDRWHPVEVQSTIAGDPGAQTLPIFSSPSIYNMTRLAKNVPAPIAKFRIFSPYLLGGIGLKIFPNKTMHLPPFFA
jgi:hypothetical protein